MRENLIVAALIVLVVVVARAAYPALSPDTYDARIHTQMQRALR